MTILIIILISLYQLTAVLTSACISQADIRNETISKIIPSKSYLFVPISKFLL